MYQLFITYLMMLWPPYFLLFTKGIFGPRSPGWGGAIESIMAPIWAFLGVCVIATWIGMGYGLVCLIQFLSQHLHWS